MYICFHGCIVNNSIKCNSNHSNYQDLREAIENLHEERILKIKTVENLQKYVKKDARLPQFLAR